MKTPDDTHCAPTPVPDLLWRRLHPSPMADYYERRCSPGRGGYRPGSGLRKGAILVPPDMKRIPVQVRLPKFLVDWMYTQDKSITKMVEHAVRQLMLRATTES